MVNNMVIFLLGELTDALNSEFVVFFQANFTRSLSAFVVLSLRSKTSGVVVCHYVPATTAAAAIRPRLAFYSASHRYEEITRSSSR